MGQGHPPQQSPTFLAWRIRPKVKCDLEWFPLTTCLAQKIQVDSKREKMWQSTIIEERFWESEWYWVVLLVTLSHPQSIWKKSKVQKQSPYIYSNSLFVVNIPNARLKYLQNFHDQEYWLFQYVVFNLFYQVIVFSFDKMLYFLSLITRPTGLLARVCLFQTNLWTHESPKSSVAQKISKSQIQNK